MPARTPKPDEPQDGLERKAGLLAKLLEVVFGKGALNWPRAAVLIVALLAGAYLAGVRLAPEAFGASGPLGARVTALELVAHPPPADLGRLVAATAQLARSINRLECVTTGGTRSDCWRSFPPLEGAPP